MEKKKVKKEKSWKRKGKMRGDWVSQNEVRVLVMMCGLFECIPERNRKPHCQKNEALM